MAVGEVFDFVVVVKNDLVVTGDAEVLPEHVTRKNIGRDQILDGVAVLHHRLIELRTRTRIIPVDLQDIEGLLQVDVQGDHAALDVTVQAQILTLLASLQKEFNMGILLITHDLGVVAQVSERVNVMYAGRVIEHGSVDDIFYNPMQPYTLGLLKSVPRISATGSERLKAIPGQPPSLISLPAGCAFAPRCEYIKFADSNACATQMPALVGTSAGHSSRCHIDESKRQASFAEAMKEVR